MSRREYTAARIDRTAMDIVRHVAAVERRTISDVIRLVIIDWAEAQALRLRLGTSLSERDVA
jgi:hypothetical protein